MSAREDERAAGTALVSLPGMGPARMRFLLEAFGTTTGAWRAVRRGDLDGVTLRAAGDNRRRLVGGWKATAARIEPDDVLRAHEHAGIEVLMAGDAAWPETFLVDPEPPVVLFARGDPAHLSSRSVAIVGTRRASAVGVRVARDLGRALAAAEVPVVSGLALGIDGAAHRGVLDGGGVPVAVVGTGLDVVYPRRHAQLWHDVAAAGLVVSEWPMGTRGDPWRFPARNRLIAALGELLVVVESARRGGSMSTVEAASERGRTVMAVPGSVLAERCEGTNTLLHEGASVVRDATDVLVALGFGAAWPATPDETPDDGRAGQDRPGVASGDPVLAALSPEAVSLDDVATTTGLGLAEVTSRLAQLEAAGSVVRDAAGYRLPVR